MNKVVRYWGRACALFGLFLCLLPAAFAATVTLNKEHVQIDGNTIICRPDIDAPEGIKCIRYKVNGETIETKFSPPWDITINDLDDGYNTIMVVIFFEENPSWHRDELIVEIGKDKKTLMVNLPGTVVEDESFRATVKVENYENIEGIKIYADGYSYELASLACSSNGNYPFIIDKYLSVGPHQVRVKLDGTEKWSDPDLIMVLASDKTQHVQKESEVAGLNSKAETHVNISVPTKAAYGASFDVQVDVANYQSIGGIEIFADGTSYLVGAVGCNHNGTYQVPVQQYLSLDPPMHELRAKVIGANVWSDPINIRITPGQKPFLPLIGILNLDPTQAHPDLDPLPLATEKMKLKFMYEGLHINGQERFKELGEESDYWDYFIRNNTNYVILPFLQPTFSADGYSLKGRTVESNFKDYASFYKEGVLAMDLSEEDQLVALKPDGMRALWLKPSTLEEGKQVNRDNYETVIMVGDEVMKILEIVDQDAGVIKVERGFQNRKSKHYVGAAVFAPIYRGGDGNIFQSKLPGEGEDETARPEYLLNLPNENLIYNLAKVGKEFIDAGATGFWISLIDKEFLFPSAAYPHAVKIWDLENRCELDSMRLLDNTYTACDLFKKQLIKMNDEGHILPQIISNNGTGQYFDDQSKVYTWVNGLDLHRDALDGIVFEDPSLYAQENKVSVDKWLEQVGAIMHACSKGWSIWPSLRTDRYAALPLEDSAEADAQQLFNYASVLMGWNSDAPGKLPIPVHKITKEGKRSLNLPSYLFYDLGKSIAPEGFLANDLQVMVGIINYQYRVTDWTYMRLWEKGAVLVNPYDTNDKGVPLNRSMYDPDNETWETYIDLPARSAKILLFKKPK